MKNPFLVGSFMAAVMLWMGHDRIMSGSLDLTVGAIWFALAHLAIGLLILAIIFLIPSARRRLRGHRPNLKHLTSIAAGMLATAGVIHLVVHGVVA